jgi:hypothetical protein
MKKNQLSKSTLKKMVAYSQATIGLLAIGGNVNAQIKYTNVDPDRSFSYNDLYDVDLDANNGIEFQIVTSSSSYYYSYDSRSIKNFANSFQFVGESNNVTPLSLSTEISSGKTFSANNGDLDLFLSLGDRFIGCRFNINGYWHYGWVRLNYSDAALVIKDFAYDTTPGKSIKAGNY